MLIGIDASRATVAQRTGTEGYSLHIIRGLLATGHEHHFRLYFREAPQPALFPPLPNVELVTLKRPSLWTHLALGPEVRHRPPDVLFVPAHVLPWPKPTVPSVVTLHDLGYLHYPGAHTLKQRLYLNWSTRHSARAARRVLVSSQSTAHDLVTLNQVPEEKIKVAYFGIDPELKPVCDAGRLEELRGRLGIPGPYILHVGRIETRKNLLRLVEAFDRIATSIPHISLVLAGHPGHGARQVLQRIKALTLTERVRLPGYVAAADLPALYSGALVYAFPSLYEGFGFPALEAMACGTPVVCSGVSSLPELVEDAALIVPPADVDALAAALHRAATDELLRQELINKGYKRAAMFTWETCAQATLDVLLEAAHI